MPYTTRVLCIETYLSFFFCAALFLSLPSFFLLLLLLLLLVFCFLILFIITFIFLYLDSMANISWADFSIIFFTVIHLSLIFSSRNYGYFFDYFFLLLCSLVSFDSFFLTRMTGEARQLSVQTKNVSVMPH